MTRSSEAKDRPRMARISQMKEEEISWPLPYLSSPYLSDVSDKSRNQVSRAA